MELLLPLVIGALFAWLCHAMATNRNRNAVGWAVGGFCFGLIPVIILACLGKLEKPPTVEEVEAMLGGEK